MSLVDNQVAKVERFVSWLDEHLPLDLDAMKLWGDDEWQAVTDLFNANRTDGRTDTVPSTTRRTIVRTLIRRRQPASDPFAGLPS